MEKNTTHRCLKIYVAGPYTAPTRKLRCENVNIAIDVGLQIWKKGHVPYIPHLTHFIDERAAETGVCMSYEEYLAWDTEWLRTCSGLLYLGSSRGADLELENAKHLGLTIYYSIDEIPYLVSENRSLPLVSNKQFT